MRKYRPLLTSILIAVVLLGLFGFSLYHYLRMEIAADNEVNQRNMLYLAESQALTVRAKIEGQFDILRAAAASIGSGLYGTEAELSAALNHLVDATDFMNVAFAGADGEALFSDGVRLNVSKRDYFRRAVSGEETIEYLDAAKLSGQPVFTFSVPVAGADGAGALLGSLYVDAFSALLSEDAEDPESYSFLSDSEGRILVPSAHKNYLVFTDNTLDFYRQAVLLNGASVETVAAQLAAGEPGALFYNYGNQYRFAIYTPLKVNGWYLFHVAPGEFADTGADYARRRLFLFSAAAILLYLTPFALLLFTRRKYRIETAEAQKKETRSKEEIERLQELSDSILFFADPATGALSFSRRFDEEFGRPTRLSNIRQLLDPEKEQLPSLLKDDYAAWKKLGQALERGVPKIKSNIRIQAANGSWGWYRVSCHCLYGGEEKPYRIIGKLSPIEFMSSRALKLAEGGRDGVTGLMNRDSFASAVNAALLRESASGEYALLVADIDNFKDLGGSASRFQGEQLLIALGEALRRCFRSADLIGRMGGDEFSVFVRDLPSRDFIVVRAQEINDCLNGLCLSDGTTVRATVSVGIVCGLGEADFESLYRHASKALYKAKMGGKDRFALAEKSATMDYGPELPADEGDPDAKGVVLKCAALLLTRDEAEAAAGVLEAVGEFYQADNAYFFRINGEKRLFRKTYEWLRKGLVSEHGFAEDTPLDAWPSIGRVAASNKLVTLAEVTPQTVPDEAERQALIAHGIDTLFMMPLCPDGKTAEAILGLDNPRAQLGHVSVIKSLSTLLSGAMRRQDAARAERNDHV